jgi:hypothetical protein
LAASSAWAGEEEATCQDLDACLAEIHELEADINLLNLVNGLHLTKEQIQVILKGAKGLEKELKGWEGAKEENSRLMEEEIKMLQSLLDHLRKGRTVPNAMRTRYEEFKKRQHSGKHAWKLKPKVLERVQEAAGRVQACLTSAQQEILSTYKPCLIPPKDLKDPVRVGQAAESAHMEGFLEKVRRLPDFLYVNRLDDILAYVVNRIERHGGGMDAKERDRYIQKLKKVCHRVRDMSETAFQLEKPDLAAQLEMKDKAWALVEQLADMGVAKYQLEGRIIQFLLVPRIIPILENRLDRMENLTRGNTVVK